MMGDELENVKCNICNADNTKILYTVKSKSRFSYAEPLNYVQCKNCGLVYTNPRPSPRFIQKQYEHEEYHPIPHRVCGKVITLPEEEFDTLLYQAWQRVKLIQKYKKSGRILDIGCGRGFELQLLKSDLWEVYGLEVAQLNIEYLKDVGLNLIRGTMDGINFRGGSIDVVTMWNVVEHLRDSKMCLLSVFEALKEDGFLFIITPNFDSFLRRIKGSKWSNMEDPGQHIYIFSKKILENVLSEIGFEILEVETFSANVWHPDTVLDTKPKKIEIKKRNIFRRFLSDSVLWATELLNMQDHLLVVCQK